MKRKITKKMAVCIAVITAFATIATTFAWFTGQDNKVNKFDATSADATIFEVFTPPTEWRPGETITKQVAVANNGESDVLVRVYFKEVLKKYSGVAVASATKGTDDSLAQLVNVATYSTMGDLASVGLTTTTLPAGVTLKAKKDTAADGRVSYGFVIYSNLANSKYGKMSATFSVNPTTNDLTISDVKYYYYPGVTNATADWLTTKPSAASINKAITDNMIEFTYGTISATPIANSWYYNATDGYFYFVGKLASGAISPNLMTNVALNGDAGNEYSGMHFELDVNMSAIQNTKAALTATSGGGWGLPASALLTALQAQCAS